MLTPFNMFNILYEQSLLGREPSVFVVSDSQLAKWKRDKAEAEIIELDKLIDSHKASIDRLTATREDLRKEYPAVEAAEDK